MAIGAIVAAGVLASVHVFAGKLRFLTGVPRSRWLSAASGVSVAYVFVYLLPELAERQEALGEAAREALPFLERHVYLVALFGLGVFYGLELAARRSRRGARAAQRADDEASDGVFWLHMASYATYNALIAYLLLHGSEDTPRQLALFTLAIGLHFVVNDFGLREHHKETYTRVGRWILAAAVFAGLAIGAAWELSEAAISAVLAFLAGGVVMNVLKEELPEDRESRLSAFAAGAAGFAALLLAL